MTWSRYAQLGGWIRACYGTPLASTNSSSSSSSSSSSRLATDTAQQPLVLTLPTPALLDRVIIQEQLQLGQRVRNFTVESQASPDAPWQGAAAERPFWRQL
jgi:hypothetical protein